MRNREYIIACICHKIFVYSSSSLLPSRLPGQTAVEARDAGGEGLKQTEGVACVHIEAVLGGLAHLQ